MKPKIAIISFPWKSNAPYNFLSDLIKIIDPISKEITIINGNTDRINCNSNHVIKRDINISMHYINEIEPTIVSAILWIKKCIKFQIKTCLEIINSRSNIDIIIFYVAYPYFLIPLILSKIINIKTVEIITRTKNNSFLDKFISLQDPILFQLLDGISPEVNSLIDKLNLNKYKKKILPEGGRFIDTISFAQRKRLCDRKKIGFIGRFCYEKGSLVYVKCIPGILKKEKNISFLMGGNGKLRDKIEKYINDNNLMDFVDIPGWIDHKYLPIYLNELKVLIVPSYSEGLPTIILEAMACGTIVLATPVGGIPSIIKDEETGFIMDDITPECIEENIIRILKHPDLERIVKNARCLIESNYSYNSAVERYERILEDI